MTDHMGMEREALTQLRHTLHRHAELSGREYETQKILRAFLEDHGMVPETCLGTGLCVELQGTGTPDESDAEGLTILRADMDALPVREATGLDHASENDGVMHACGHDAHSAMLAAALVWLKREPSRWAGRVRAIFQPAEETNTHTEQLRATGLLDGATRAFALHVMPQLPLGTYGCDGTAVMAGSKALTITLDGRGGHGAMPHLGVDGVVAAAAVVQALQTVVAREIDPKEPAVLTLGSLHAGETWNVLAEHAVMEGTLRFYDPAVGDRLVASIDRLLQHTAEAYRMTPGLKIAKDLPPLQNDADTAETLAARLEGAADIPGYPAPRRVPQPVLSISEDFSRYVHEVPGVMAFLGSASPDHAGSDEPLHDHCFYPPDAILPYGVRLHLAAAGFGL